MNVKFFDLSAYDACLKSIREIGAFTLKQKEAELIVNMIEAGVENLLA